MYCTDSGKTRPSHWPATQRHREADRVQDIFASPPLHGQAGLCLYDVQRAGLLPGHREAFRCGHTHEGKVHPHHVWRDHQNPQPHSGRYLPHPGSGGHHTFPLAL